MVISRLFPLAFAVLLACGDDTSPVGGGGSEANGGGDEGAGGAGAGDPSGGGGSDTGGGGGSCSRDPLPADRDRFVVVGHPYDDSAGEFGSYEVLGLSGDGELSELGETFVMGESAETTFVFTPDGELGFSAQEDGTIGVFRLDEDGAVEVLDVGFEGSFYANKLTMGLDGSTLYVVDVNFPKNGGGVYSVAIGCDGTLTDQGRLFESKNAESMHFLGEGDRAVLAARGALGSTDVVHAHTITMPDTLEESVALFPDDDAILSWSAVTRDQRFLLVGDNSSFSGIPNRIGIAEITAGGLVAKPAIADFEDPFAIATSPFNDAAIVTSGFGDDIFVFDYDPDAAAPFTLRGPLSETSKPQLPGALATLDRGPLDGLVLIGDVRGVYALHFEPNGVVVDDGVFELDLSNVIGIGIQP